METSEVEKSASSEETACQLNRNRSFKSKQLVRSQAIRETASPPRAVSPTPAAPTSEVTDDSSHRCNDDLKKKLPVEIQITSGGWDETHCERQRARRWMSDSCRDLLSNNPRVACVCGTCACPNCRGRRRRHVCPTKQDSGIVCSDDCPDCTDLEPGGSNNDGTRKSSSLDVDDQMYYCRCPERKERPKSMMLSRSDSGDYHKYDKYEPTGPELVAFLKETLNKNPRDRMALLKIEKELHTLINDTGRCIMRFPVMTSYGRMLVHRCASLFQLSHHLDMNTKTAVLVSKSGTCGGRIPCTSFKEWCTATFPPSPQRHQPDVPHAKSILKRDTHSLDEPGTGSLASNRSKSLEQREREYERVRRRIFSSQDEVQWPWLTSGPVKLLTPEGGRNKLLKVQSLEGNGAAASSWRGRVVSKSHSFGGYTGAEPPQQPRLLSRQGDLASSSWRLSPSSSGYKTLSLRSTDSITPSPTGGASPEPNVGVSQGACPALGAEGPAVVWAVTDLSAVPRGAVVIHPQTGRALTNPDGSVYHFDPANPPVLYDPGIPVAQTDQQMQMDQNNEKRRGRLEKQHSFMDHECECQAESPPHANEEWRNKCCCECRRHESCHQQQQPPIRILEKEPNLQITSKPPTPTHEPHQPTPQIENTHPTQLETTNEEPIAPTPNQNTEPETNRSFENQNSNNDKPLEVNNAELTNHKPLEIQKNVDSTNHKQFEIQNSVELTNNKTLEPQKNFNLTNNKPFELQNNIDNTKQFEVQNSVESINHKPYEVQKSIDTINQKPFEVQRTGELINHNPYENHKSVESTNQNPYEIQKNVEYANQKPYETQKSHETANHKQFEILKNIESTNNKPFEVQKSAETYNQKPMENQKSVESYNQKPFENQKSYEMQRSVDYSNQKPYEMQRNMELTNHRGSCDFNKAKDCQELQYQQYPHPYRTEEVTSPPQFQNHFISQEMSLQVMQNKMTPVPMPDPNIRPMSLTNVSNVMYPATVAQGYPYGVRLDQPMVYQQLVQPEEQKLAPSPLTNETGFRIDPSYPYAAVDYTGAACGACVDTTVAQHPQRSYSVPYSQVEVPQVLPTHYPVGNMILPQPHLQPYPYQEALPWAVAGQVAPTPKLMVPELYPTMVPYHQPAYPHYNIMYPQVIPQPYPLCQPIYPIIESKPPERRNSIPNSRIRRNSITSSRNTPDKVPYEEQARQAEIAAKIQQIKSQMAQLNVKDKRPERTERTEWKEGRRRNSGNGILGNCPVNNFNGRVMGRSHDETHLSTAARAIVNSIRNMQAKNNTYQEHRREYQRFDYKDRPRRQDRDDKDKPSSGQSSGHERYDARNRGLNVPLYRQPYLFRQMSPGAWCRRSPAPVHPVLNPPRRPHPDSRNPRR